MNSLQKKISDAFGIEVDSGRVSEEEADEMARALPRLVAKDAKLLAARLMIHFCETDTLLSYSSSGDHLVFFLDGSPQRGEARDPILDDMVEEGLRDFSEDEAKVVYEWLQNVGRKRFVRLCGEDVESSLAYWKGRLGS